MPRRTLAPGERKTAIGIRNTKPTTQNLLTYSEDVSQAAWVKNTGVSATLTNEVSGPFPGDQVSKIVYNGSSAGSSYRFVQATGIVPATPVAKTAVIWLRTLSGLVNLDLYINTFQFKRITITGSWQKFVFTDVTATTPISQLIMQFYDSGANPSFTIYATRAQLSLTGTEQPYVKTTSSPVNTGNPRNTLPLVQNLLFPSEPTVLADLYSKQNITVDPYAWPVQIGAANGVTFSSNALLRYAYQSNLVIDAQKKYTLRLWVVMDDASSPVISDSTSASDFQLVFSNAPVVGTVKHISGSLYTVEYTGYGVPVTGLLFGAVKYTTNSAKGFKITGYQLVGADNIGAYVKGTLTAVNTGDPRNNAKF